MDLGDAYAFPVWFGLEGREEERSLHPGPAPWSQGMTIVPRNMKFESEPLFLIGLLIIEGYMYGCDHRTHIYEGMLGTTEVPMDVFS